jgi:hypothetical protein
MLPKIQMVMLLHTLAVGIWFESLEHMISQTQTYLAYVTYVGFKLMILMF